MKKLNLLILLTLLFSMPVHPQDIQPCGKGRTPLFNGRDLAGWEITPFGTQGDVYVKDGSIILGYGDGCTGITYKKDLPKINYEVRLQAKRISGSDFFCGLTFPVKDEFATLIVGGWGGTVIGLSCIDGYDASENETSRMKKFEKNRWYDIRLQVTEEGIKAWIDDILFVDHILDERPLSVRSEVLLSRPFGIASWQTTAAIRNICLKKMEAQ